MRFPTKTGSIETAFRGVGQVKHGRAAKGRDPWPPVTPYRVKRLYTSHTLWQAQPFSSSISGGGEVAYDLVQGRTEVCTLFPPPISNHEEQ